LLRNGARASAPAEIRSGQRYYLQAFTSPVLLHPKKDLKPVPLTGWPILHCRGAKTQSKLGRVPHVRDAPLSSRSKTSGGQRTARPTNAIVTACDCLGRRKPAAKITGGARASAPAEITLRLTLLLHRSYCSAISTPPKRPQTNPGHRQSLRPGWPRAKSTQARDRTGPRRAAAKMAALQSAQTRTTVSLAENLQPRCRRARMLRRKWNLLCIGARLSQPQQRYRFFRKVWSLPGCEITTRSAILRKPYSPMPLYAAGTPISMHTLAVKQTGHYVVLGHFAYSRSCMWPELAIDEVPQDSV